MKEIMPGFFFGAREAEPARKVEEVSVNLWDFANKETIKRNMRTYAGLINQCYDCYRKDTLVTCSESDGDVKSMACIAAYFIIYRKYKLKDVLELFSLIVEFNGFYLDILKSFDGSWSNPGIRIIRTWSIYDPISRERKEYSYITPSEFNRKEGS